MLKCLCLCFRYDSFTHMYVTLSRVSWTNGNGSRYKPLGVLRGDAGGTGSDNDSLGDQPGVAGLRISKTVPSHRGD